MINTKVEEVFGKNPVINSNDIRQSILNIDTRFRESHLEPASDCVYKMSKTYKNVIKLRVASCEIPDITYNISKSKKNSMFRIDVSDYTGTQHYLTITVEDGYYSAECLVKKIQEKFNGIKDMYGIFLRITMDEMSRRVTIFYDGSAAPPCPPGPSHCSVPFGITFLMVGLEERVYDFGLGSVLGFVKPFYTVEAPYQITGESVIDVTGDKYFLLAMNDFYSVDHKMTDGPLQTLAKIIVKRNPSGIIYDNGSNVLANEIVFPRPMDLSQVRIRLLDAYGVPIDLHHSNYSISLEVWEVTNIQLYDHYRTYLWPHQEPRATKQTSGSSAPIALPGGLNYN